MMWGYDKIMVYCANESNQQISLWRGEWQVMHSSIIHQESLSNTLVIYMFKLKASRHSKFYALFVAAIALLMWFNSFFNFTASISYYIVRIYDNGLLCLHHSTDYPYLQVYYLKCAPHWYNIYLTCNEKKYKLIEQAKTII